MQAASAATRRVCMLVHQLAGAHPALDPRLPLNSLLTLPAAGRLRLCARQWLGAGGGQLQKGAARAAPRRALWRAQHRAGRAAGRAGQGAGCRCGGSTGCAPSDGLVCMYFKAGGGVGGKVLLGLRGRGGGRQRKRADRAGAQEGVALRAGELLDVVHLPPLW